MTHSTHRWIPSNLRRVLLVAALVAASGASVAHARPTQPRKNDRQITLAVAMLMERQHLTGHRLDNTISDRCLTTFLKDLDPMKMFFLQSDVDEFSRNKNNISESIRHGDIRFAYDIFDRFLQRVDERITLAETDLSQPQDYNLDEEMVRDPKVTTFPKTTEEAAERWRQRVKFDLLKETADKVPMDEAVKKLTKRYEAIRKSWQQTDEDELMEMYLTAMTSAFDPHSDYMAPSTLTNFNIQMKLELEGIGASLRGLDGFTVVENIIPGGAADKNGGLKTKDKIVGVGEGTNGPIEDIVDLKLNDVVKKIRGKRGTVVRLQVDPADGSERKVIAITREKIELKDSEARGEIIKQGKKADGSPFQIGVIQLPSFYMDMDGARLGLNDYKSTSRDVRRILEEFKSKGVDAVVVDLRWNGGGSLTEAVQMTGLFIDKGPVVQVKGPDGRTSPYADQDVGLVWDGPLVVIINKLSASASEIFAGAIQDYDRGLIIGDHSTHGKGTVQQMYDLATALFRLNAGPNMGALKLTIQQFYRPDGDSTQKRGVESDVELPALTAHLDVGESDLDYALEFSQVPALPHDHFHMVDSTIKDGLRKRSADRLKNSEFFAKANREISHYEEQKAKKTVTLNKDKFLKERAELDTDKEQEKMFDGMNDPKRPVFERDGYDDEVLDIVVDYLNQLGSNNKMIIGRTTASPAQSGAIPQ